MSQPTGPVTLLGNPDDDFNDIVANLRPDCPTWCTGHQPSDDDATFCVPAFYDWVDVDGDGDDNVTVTASQYPGEQPRICVFPGDSEKRGVRLTDAETDKLISLLIGARKAIAPVGNTEWDDDPKQPKRDAA